MLTQGFLYGGQLNPIAELDGVNNVVARFVYATRANVPDYAIMCGGVYRIYSDHIGIGVNWLSDGPPKQPQVFITSALF